MEIAISMKADRLACCSILLHTVAVVVELCEHLRQFVQVLAQYVQRHVGSHLTDNLSTTCSELEKG